MLELLISYESDRDCPLWKIVLEYAGNQLQIAVSISAELEYVRNNDHYKLTTSF